MLSSKCELYFFLSVGAFKKDYVCNSLETIATEGAKESSINDNNNNNNNNGPLNTPSQPPPDDTTLNNKENNGKHELNDMAISNSVILVLL